MKRVTGIGGIFFQAENPAKLYEWYEKHLGIKSEPNGQGAMLHWREDENPERRGMTVWALFEKHSKYFEPSRAPFMLNYRVDDLDALLEALRVEGVSIDPKREDYDYGRFAWIPIPRGIKSSCGSRRKRSDLMEPERHKCTACGGTGDCPVCKGTSNGGQCTKCLGTGRCPNCQGTGRNPSKPAG